MPPVQHIEHLGRAFLTCQTFPVPNEYSRDVEAVQERRACRRASSSNLGKQRHPGGSTYERRCRGACSILDKRKASRAANARSTTRVAGFQESDLVKLDIHING